MAVVIAYMLVLQGVAGSYARASVINPAETFHVICASSGNMDAGSENNGVPSKKNMECPCALLCRLANAATPAVLASVDLVIATLGAIRNQPVTGLEKSPLPQPRRLIAEPRGPPQIS